MQKYITREEIADDLGLTVPEVSQAIAAKIIPVSHYSGRVPRLYYKTAKFEGENVKYLLRAHAKKTNIIWGTVIGLGAAGTVTGIVLSFLGVL